MRRQREEAIKEGTESINTSVYAFAISGCDKLKTPWRFGGLVCFVFPPQVSLFALTC